jgi:hypothetical protein
MLPSPVFNVIAGTEWSISFWFRPTHAPSGYNILGCATAGGWAQPIQVRLVSGYHLRVIFGNADGSEGVVFTDSANPLTLNQWAHIALTFKTVDGSTHPLTVYIDGVPVQVNAGATRAFASRDGHLGARNASAGQGSCTGDYAVLGIWDRCLDYEEVLAQYSTGTVVQLTPGLPVVVAADGYYNAWPGLTRTVGGRLIGSFSTGNSHENGEQASFVVHSDDNGLTWSAPAQVSPSASGGSRYLSAGVVALDDGDVLHGYYKDPDGVLYVKASSDSGATWGSPTAITGWTTSYAGGQSLFRSPTTLRTFYVFFGVDSGETAGRYKVGVVYSDNAGGSWSAPIRIGPANDVGKYNEATITELADGTLAVFVRSEQSNPGHIYMATSIDNGVTWSSLSTLNQGDPDTFEVRPGCPAGIYVTSADAIVMLYRQKQSGSVFSTCYRISRDNGATWGSEHVLDTGNYEYAGVVLLDSNTLGVLYAVDNPAGQDATDPGRCDVRFVTVDVTVT